MKKKQPTKKKLRIGILFGGRSGEHEVSLLSAASILKAIDRNKYEVIPIGITKNGQWLSLNRSHAPPRRQHKTRSSPAQIVPQDIQNKLHRAKPQSQSHPIARRHLPRPPRHLRRRRHHPGPLRTRRHRLRWLRRPRLRRRHGQGRHEAALRRRRTSRKPRTSTSLRSEWQPDPKRCTKQIETALNYPVFVKPANLGSSVGISKVHDRAELAPAMDLAASFDRKLIIEQGVGGPGAKPRELEVAVLGNDSPIASVVGEIVPGAEFYDYDAKYHSDTSVPIIPAKLTAAESKQIREMAIAAFRACDCAGLARVDFLMEPATNAKENKKAKPAASTSTKSTPCPASPASACTPSSGRPPASPTKTSSTVSSTLAVERHQRKATDQLHPRLNQHYGNVVCECPAAILLQRSTHRPARRSKHRHHRQTSRSIVPQPKTRCRIHRAAPSSPRRSHPSARLLDRSHSPPRQRTRRQPQRHLPAGPRARSGRNAQPENSTPTRRDEHPTPNPGYTKTENQYNLAQRELASHSESRLHHRRRLTRLGQHQHRPGQLLSLAQARSLRPPSRHQRRRHPRQSSSTPPAKSPTSK